MAEDLGSATGSKQGIKRVVIIGGGFAGLATAKQLENKKNIEVVLIDRRNHHLFQPLLYQVATAGLNPADIAAPIRAQFSKAPNVTVMWGQAKTISLESKKVYLHAHHGHEDGAQAVDMELEYDYLVVACGAKHSYFGNNHWEEFAPGLKTLEQATEIRRRILSAFERAENESDPEIQKALLTFVIVGGGPTGVELAGAIADISRTVLVKDFRKIDPSQAKVILVEAGPRILAAFEPKISENAKKALEKLGVDVRLETKVENIDAYTVKMNGEGVPSRSVLWAAGVEATKLKWQPEVEADRAGRIKVTERLSLAEYPEVQVIGDMAVIQSDGKMVPGLAPAAMQEGRYAAKNILNQLSGKDSPAFKYKDKGIMATIGKKQAVVQTSLFKMYGMLAWLIWLFVHIFYLVGFKNRMSVMVQWTWSYMFSRRGARLITERDWRQAPLPPASETKNS